VAKDGININALAFIGADVENGLFQRFLAATGLPQDQVLSAIPWDGCCPRASCAAPCGTWPLRKPGS
jgi:hypothetical protein